MLSYTDLKKGTVFVLNGEPYEVLESSFLRMQQRKAVVQTKIRNLVSGKILDRNWQASDEFEEAEVEKMAAVFIYAKPLRPPEVGQEYWFNEEGNPQNRFALKDDILGSMAPFLAPDMKVTALTFNGKVIKISIPIKVDVEVIEAPPSVKGNTAQGGTKVVTVEGGVKVSVPLFINTGDVIRINTETGEYVERVEKG